MTPRHALERAIFMMGAVDRGRGNVPGWFIQHQDAEGRAALEHLTSADAVNVRDDVVRWFVDKPGFCGHGWKFTEECASCRRSWKR